MPPATAVSRGHAYVVGASRAGNGRPCAPTKTVESPRVFRTLTFKIKRNRHYG